MTELRQWLKAEFERNRWTYQAGAKELGLSSTMVHRLINNPDFVPGFEVYAQLAKWSGRQIYEIMELDGHDLGVPRSPTEQGERIASLLRIRPDLAPVLERLPQFQPDDVQAMLGLFEKLLRREH